jgi:hypothetical protein
LFTRRDIGKNKAEALASHTHLKELTKEIVPDYLSEDNKKMIIDDPSTNLILISATDNYPARRLALDIVDERPLNTTLLVSPGNEYESAEGYVYMKQWRNHEMHDPRVRFPEHMTDTEGDPLSPSCTGEEVTAAHPQLALANMEGAVYAVKLMHFWINKSNNLLNEWVLGGGSEEQILKTFPVRYSSAPGFIKQENLI